MSAISNLTRPGCTISISFRKEKHVGLSARKPKDLISPAPDTGLRGGGVQGERTLHSAGQVHNPLANGRLILEERSATLSSQSPGRSTKLQRAIDGLGDILSNPPEGDDVGFMMSIFANCHLPRVQTKERSYALRGGDFGILMTAGKASDPSTGDVVEQPLHFGGKSRIFLAYINTQAVKTDCRDIFMGDNISDCIHRMTDQRGPEEVVATSSAGSGSSWHWRPSSPPVNFACRQKKNICAKASVTMAK